MTYLSSKPISENNFRAVIDKALVDMNVLGDPMPGINNESGYSASGPLAPLNKVSAIPMSIKS